MDISRPPGAQDQLDPGATTQSQGDTLVTSHCQGHVGDGHGAEVTEGNVSRSGDKCCVEKGPDIMKAKTRRPRRSPSTSVNHVYRMQQACGYETQHNYTRAVQS